MIIYSKNEKVNSNGYIVFGRRPFIEVFSTMKYKKNLKKSINVWAIDENIKCETFENLRFI